MFTITSQRRLYECDKQLQDLFLKVEEAIPCAVICGHRGQEEQDKAYAEGKSTKKWPNGKHNKMPSVAIDVAPIPLDWDDEARFIRFGNFVEGVAHSMGIKIIWGGDWAQPYDLVHFELA